MQPGNPAVLVYTKTHGMKILIVSDAWVPQTNGVVTTLSQTVAHLRHFGHTVRVVTQRRRVAVDSVAN